MNQNPFPVPEGDHPVLDEVVNIGLLQGTTIRQMRNIAVSVNEDMEAGRTGGIPADVSAAIGGLALTIVYLADKIEALTTP